MLMVTQMCMCLHMLLLVLSLCLLPNMEKARRGSYSRGFSCLLFIYFYSMLIGGLLTCIVCVLHVFSTFLGQQSATDSLELELQKV